jgi:hypothetical protein
LSKKNKIENPVANGINIQMMGALKFHPPFQVEKSLRSTNMSQ